MPHRRRETASRWDHRERERERDRDHDRASAMSDAVSVTASYPPSGYGHLASVQSAPAFGSAPSFPPMPMPAAPLVPAMGPGVFGPPLVMPGRRLLPTYMPAPAASAPAPSSTSSASASASAPASASESELEHRAIALYNKLDYEGLAIDWVGDAPDPLRHMFTPDGVPRYYFELDLWKPLVRAYFAWFRVPPRDSTKTWTAIVEGLLDYESRGGVLPPPFAAWAYSCLCKFYIRDTREHQRESQAQRLRQQSGAATPSAAMPEATFSPEYDPEHPAM